MKTCCRANESLGIADGRTLAGVANPPGKHATTSVLDRLANMLSLPAGYRVFRRLIGGAKVFRDYLQEYVKPVPGEKVLDMGCGPGDVLSYLPEVSYTGIDLSPEYIESARRRFGARGRFFCGDVGSFALAGEACTFDLVLATGVVHHLDDALAAHLFEEAGRMLRPGGRLVTFDGCYAREQNGLARWLLGRDRGKFVRTQVEYERLAKMHFTRIEAEVRHDMLRIPYTHLILRCSSPTTRRPA